MYFKFFPYTMYTLDNYRSAQLVTNFLVRSKILDKVKEQFGVYDEYDIREGETPELLADRIYGNPELHWLILLYNDILDPRFGWPLDSAALNSYITSKHGNSNNIDHYEDSDGNTINGVLTLESSAEFTEFTADTVVVNVTGTGTGVVTELTDTSTLTLTVTTGGFRDGDQIKIYDTDTVANITSTTVVTGIPVTVYEYEDAANEAKRRIKILKPQYVDVVVTEFGRSVGA